MFEISNALLLKYAMYVLLFKMKNTIYKPKNEILKFHGPSFF